MPRIRANGLQFNVSQIPKRRRRGGGPATPIVFVHGLAASSAFWYAAGAEVMSLLGDCHLYDLRGHGRSEATESGYGVTSMSVDLEALLDALGIGRAHLVAHSFGGMVALRLALRTPDRVRSLVLADVRVRALQGRIAIPRRVIPPEIAARLAALGIDLETAGEGGEGIAYLSTMARIQLAAGEEEAGELLAALYRHPRLFRSRRTAARWLELIDRGSLVSDVRADAGLGSEDLARLRLPMLVLAGQRSATIGSARRLKEVVPHAVLKEIPNVGHFFPMSHPRLFLRPALRFIRAVNRGSSVVRAG